MTDFILLPTGELSIPIRSERTPGCFGETDCDVPPPQEAMERA